MDLHAVEAGGLGVGRALAIGLDNAGNGMCRGEDQCQRKRRRDFSDGCMAGQATDIDVFLRDEVQLSGQLAGEQIAEQAIAQGADVRTGAEDGNALWRQKGF